MRFSTVFFVLLVIAALAGAGYWYSQQDSAEEVIEVAGSTTQEESTTDAEAAEDTNAAEGFVPAPRGDGGAGFDLDQAFTVAGSHVPQEVSEFYLYVVKEEVSVAENRDELVELIRSAQKDKDYLAVVGANGELNFDVFNAALDVVADESVADVIFIYLGRSDHEAALRQRVEPTEAEFRFSAYPDTQV